MVPVERPSNGCGANSEIEKLLLCPESAATYAAYVQALGDGRIGRHERVMLCTCATGLKYPMPVPQRRLDKDGAIDYAAL